MSEPTTLDARSRVDALIERAAQSKASDLHFMAQLPPHVRILGELQPVPGEPPLEPRDIEAILDAVLPAGRRADRNRNEIDFSYGDPKGRRLRVSAFRERRGRAIAFRLLGATPPSLDELELPRDLLRSIYAPSGLVLFAGAAGQGKTTTLASVLQELCRRRPAHLVTLEDPVEYRLDPGIAWVEQREVGQSCASFERGLREALEAEPDVISIGELRDLETMRAALEAAETGILVFATVHAYDATRAIGRIVDAFELEERSAARLALAGSLRMICAQALLQKVRGRGRLAAIEVVQGCTSVSTLIREGKEHELVTVIESSRGRGMRLLDDSIIELVRAGKVTPEEARFFAVHKDVVARRLEEVGA